MSAFTDGLIVTVSEVLSPLLSEGARQQHFASTTEVGLWAGSLIRATDYTGNEEFLQIAEAAVRPWLRFGFDGDVGKYYGRLAVDSGTPQPPEEPRGWMPPMYAEVFDIHERPTHNYPMPMAETCLSLAEKTGDPVFVEAVERWVSHIRNSLPANGERGAYAEDYGRVDPLPGTRISIPQPSGISRACQTDCGRGDQPPVRRPIRYVSQPSRRGPL